MYILDEISYGLASLLEFYVDYSRVFWRPKIKELYGIRCIFQITDITLKEAVTKSTRGDFRDALLTMGNIIGNVSYGQLREINCALMMPNLSLYFSHLCHDNTTHQVCLFDV